MQPRAQALIYETVQKQSALLAFLDVFWLLWQLALASVPLVLLTKNIRRGAGGGRALTILMPMLKVGKCRTSAVKQTRAH